MFIMIFIDHFLAYMHIRGSATLIRLRISLQVCMYVCMYVLCMYVYVCMCICMYACMHTCTFINQSEAESQRKKYMHGGSLTTNLTSLFKLEYDGNKLVKLHVCCKLGAIVYKLESSINCQIQA